MGFQKKALPGAQYVAMEVMNSNQDSILDMAAAMTSNKRHSAAKLQNDVGRTLPRPLAMSIQLSSAVVSSIGWDVFWVICSRIGPA